MKVTVYSCFFFFVLGSNVAAEIIHEVLEEKQQVTLRCPHPLEGKLTWSREINGSKVDLITIDGDKETRYNDPRKRYSSVADKSLHINKAHVSDSGKYLCNNKAAVELTVIPSGTIRLSVTERTSVPLKCPPDAGGSEVPTWSRETAGKQQQIRRPVSAVDKTLTLTDVQLGDSGLFYCDGKPVAYLNVTRGRESPPTTSTAPTVSERTTIQTASDRTQKGRGSRHEGTKPTSTTSIATATTTSTTASKNLKPAPGLVVGVAVPVFLFLLIIIYFTWRRRFKRRGKEEIHHVYDEIQDRLVCPPKNGVGPATFSMTPFSGELDQHEPTYSTICDDPPTEGKIATESPYSLISNAVVDGSNKGRTKVNNSTYVLLENPELLETTTAKYRPCVVPPGGC